MMIAKKALAMAAAALMIVSSHAVTILTFDDVLGTISPGQPADEGSELIFVNTLLGFDSTGVYSVSYSGPEYKMALVKKSPYTFDVRDSSHYGDTATGGAKVDGNVPTITGISGPYFVLGKYGPVDYVWYVAGGDAIIPTVTPGKAGKGLSHRTTFTAHTPEPPVNVPDGGTTIAFLAIAVAGLGLLGRRLS